MSGDIQKKGSIREILQKSNFDSSKFIEQVFPDISEDVDPDKLLSIFTDATEKMLRVSQNINDEILSLQDAATVADNALVKKLDGDCEKLINVGNSLNKTMEMFERSNTSALRISDRLAVTERERKRIEQALSLLNYIKDLQVTPPSLFKQLEQLDGDDLLSNLPCDFPSKTWGEISTIIHSLNRILTDITTDFADNAQRNIQLLSDIIETQLLTQFENVVMKLMSDINNKSLENSAKDLANSLFLFNGGSHIQRRFIFGIIQNRIPQNYMENISIPITINTNKYKNLGLGNISVSEDIIKSLGLNNISLGMKNKDKNTDNNNNIEIEEKVFDSGPEYTEQLNDHLSQLFGGLSTLCIEQSKIISMVFPSYAIDRINRQLLLRIFNDPAFGLQTIIDTMLRPRPPRQQLSPADYLDILATVREKLYALEAILLECFSNNGNEFNDGIQSIIIQQTSQNQNQGYNSQETLTTTLVTDDSHSMNKALLKTFIEEQVDQLFQQYQNNYFSKEMSLLRQRFRDGLIYALKDNSLIQSVDGRSNSLPSIRSDRIKSIHQICRPGGVATKSYISNVVLIAEDAVSRMLVISRDDKKLPSDIKDVYLTLQHFLADGILMHIASATNAMLCKIATSGGMLATMQSTATGQSLQPIPTEFIIAVGCVFEGITLLKNSFEKTFSNPISAIPNALLAVKEIGRKVFKKLDVTACDCARAWAWAQVSYIEFLLNNFQSKYDFRPKNGIHSPEPTAACLEVSAALKKSLQDAVKFMQNTNIGEIIWAPLAELFIGALICHIRRFKISPEGALLLVLDLDEYKKALDGPPPNFPSCVMAKELILSVREASFVFMVSSSDIYKVVSEDLRHLDASVVMGLLCARDDFVGGGTPWAKQLAASFPSLTITGPLPWEGRRHPTQLPHGPTSLRQGDIHILSESATFHSTPATAITVLNLDLIAPDFRNSNGENDEDDIDDDDVEVEDDYDSDLSYEQEDEENKSITITSNNNNNNNNTNVNFKSSTQSAVRNIKHGVKTFFKQKI